MLDAFAACRELGAVAGVHAELGAVIAENEKRLAARGVTGPTVLSRNKRVAGNLKLNVSLSRARGAPDGAAAGDRGVRGADGDLDGAAG